MLSDFIILLSTDLYNITCLFWTFENILKLLAADMETMHGSLETFSNVGVDLFWKNVTDDFLFARELK